MPGRRSYTAALAVAIEKQDSVDLVLGLLKDQRFTL